MLGFFNVKAATFSPLELLEAIPQALIAADAEGRIVYWNALARQRYNWQPEEVLGQRADELVSMPETASGAAVPQPAEGYRGELWLKGSHGETIRAWGVLTPIQNALGQRQGSLYLLSHDEEAAAELAQSEARYRALVEAGSTAVWRTNAAGELVWSNQDFEKLSGLTLESAQGEGWLNVVHPDDQPKAAYAWRDSMQSGELFDVEIRVKGADGHYRWIRSRAAPIVDARGRVVEWVGSDSDISAQVAARMQALRSERILESSLNEIYMFDVGTLRFTQVNRGARENLGYSMAELSNMTPLDLKPEFDQERFERLIEPLRRGEAPVTVFETVHRRKNGTLYPVEVHLQLFEEVSPPVFVAIILDITERKREEERLQFLSRSSQLLNASLDYQAVLQRLAELVVPRWADWCVVSLLEGETIETAALAHHDPAKVAWARELRTRYPVKMDLRSGTPNVIRTGRPELHSEIPEAALEAYARDEDERELLHKVRYRSVLIVPLKTRGKTIGAITLVWSETSRRYSEADLNFAEELAQRAATAIDNARLFEAAQRANQAYEALNLDLERRVIERTQQVQALAGQLTLAESREQARLAQMLHDDLQQQLFAVQFALKDVARSMGENSEALARLEEAGQLVKEAVVIARRTTANLSPPVLRGEGLVEAITWLGSDMKERYGLSVRVKAAAPFIPSESVRVLLFNLVRELLFNVVKHAEVNEATVQIVQRECDLQVTVSDRGAGFDARVLEGERAGTGLGLSGVRERLELFGGRLTVASRPGQGTRVTIALPATALILG